MRDYPLIDKTDFSSGTSLAVMQSRVLLGGGDVARVMGWTVCETTATGTAKFRLHDGGSAVTPSFGGRSLQPFESFTDWFGPHGLVVVRGRIFLEIVSGSIEGVLYWLRFSRVEEHYASLESHSVVG